MSLSKEECHELFVYFGDKSVPGLSKAGLEGLKEGMESGLLQSLVKLTGLFK